MGKFVNARSACFTNSNLKVWLHLSLDWYFSDSFTVFIFSVLINKYCRGQNFGDLYSQTTLALFIRLSTLRKIRMKICQYSDPICHSTKDMRWGEARVFKSCKDGEFQVQFLKKVLPCKIFGI